MISITLYHPHVDKIWETQINLQTTVAVYSLCTNPLYFQIHGMQVIVNNCAAISVTTEVLL